MNIFIFDKFEYCPKSNKVPILQCAWVSLLSKTRIQYDLGKVTFSSKQKHFHKIKNCKFREKLKTKKKETNNTSKIFRMENQKFNSIRKYNWPRFGIEFSDTLYELVWIDICQTQIQLGYNWRSFTKYLDLARSNSQPWKTQLMKTKVQSIQLLYHRALYQ